MGLVYFFFKEIKWLFDMYTRKLVIHCVMALPIVIYQENEHYRQWNRGTWSSNLNAKWIGLWYVPKAPVVLNMHCFDGLFDQMWFSCEPYIVVLSWNWSFILLIVINSNKCLTSEGFFLSLSSLKSLKTTIGEIMRDFDISFWSVDKKIVKDKYGGL